MEIMHDFWHRTRPANFVIDFRIQTKCEMDRVKPKTFLRQTSNTMENNTELCCTG